MHFLRSRHHLSPVIFLFIFFTSFGNAISRHRVRHHRDRFKRQQGENLYLPDSYVTEGGDGQDAGPWMEWSTPNLCSRTCGGGVSTQQRQCQPGYTCQGPTTRHFSCNTQDCPDTGDFRAEQCAEFDSVPFEGVNYQWVPYTKAPNPCELNCMPRGERFYYRHKAAVIDGTRCTDDSFNVCVQGKCQPVGCDMMLGSNMREDKCRRCGGDGSTCKTVQKRITDSEIQNGYNDVLLIPSGATNILVEEIEPSNNYLAVRNTKGEYYLNGNWRIDFPRSIEFAGCKFTYSRYPQGFSAPDKLTCLGPTDEPLFIVLLAQDRNVGIDYEYSLPTNIQPGSENETYAWTFDQFTPCTSSCGGGIQYRNVSCVGRRNLEPADRGLCDPSNEPASTQKCSEVPCEASWIPYPWSRCSAPCGQGGIQTREVSCQQIVSNGYSSIVDESECLKSQPKPPLEQPCNQGQTCAQWHTGHWKPCDHLCDEGKQTREVKCYIKEGSNIRILSDSECEAVEPKPESEKKCNIRPCEGLDWVTSEWSGCNKCGLTNETRKVQCATSQGEIYADDLCAQEQKPEVVRQCETTNTSCEYLWYASQWSECSADCGEGVQTRTIFCGVKNEKGEVKEAEKEKCDVGRTYETIKNCTSEVKECGGEWFSGPWKECSKPCGGGKKTRKVVCLKNSTVVTPSECSQDSIIFAEEDCNKQPCSEDTILPTDVTKTIDESETGATEETTVSGETDKPSDEEFEIVPDDECEDGEWVDEDGEPVTDEESKQRGKLRGTSPLGSSTESSATGETSESGLTDDDLMLSDSTASSDDLTTGSGDTEATSPSGITDGSSPSGGSTDLSESTLEGSGDTSGTSDSSIITDVSETDTEIDLETSPSGGSSTGDSSEATTESGTTDDGTTSSGGSTDSVTDGSSSTTDSSGATDSSSSSDGSSDSTTESSKSTDSNTESSGSTDSTESTDSTPTTESTDSTPTTESTESTESSLSTSSDSSSSTTDGSSSSESSTDSSTGSSTTDSSDGSSSSGTTTESPTSSKTTIEDSGGINEIDPDDLAKILAESSTTSASSSQSTGSTESTVENTESTETSETTTGGSSTDSSSSGSTSESTVGGSESTETSSSSEATTTESPGSTDSTTEFTGSTETDIWSSTTESGSTDETTASDLWGTTPITDIFETSKPRMCKRKKEKDCKTSEFGCCWDHITPAEGPFGQGCPNPKTCNETKFGCCQDGVSPALGSKFKGCPPTYCNETLFGCCSDNATAAEGPNEEGCPPPPPKCASSRYGCCKDNATEAKGPKQKGCEKEPEKEEEKKPSAGDCNNSTYRCCPDGKTEAEGPNFKGCDLPCSNSTYGCCSDGVTPAHGYTGEGCCLAQAHGCCPDNITPARGPNLEGCGCQYSPYRCCPDNKTAARGHNNEGCGCQHTENGCCPDNYTPAAGSDYQGCLCHTYQFGCCPDGVTIAQGPHQQGCGCRNSQYGCCSDENTPAQGPNQEGCGCDSSKFGCCPDGTTEARGDNFEGCENVPVNHQDSCMLSKERGTCHNYTVKWFFDMDYGGCSRFWYGGCGGNENRFKSKEECDGICVEPQGTERCNLPKVPGPCEGYYPMWFYDKERKHCTQFVYGGCLGNNNRFETSQECQSLCVRDSSVDACEQKRDEGPCHGSYRRWFYDKESKTCQQFAYGGCKGNNNNFATEEGCKQQCSQPGRKKDHCSLPRAQGNCTGREAKWYYDTPEKRCLPFYYSGCNGNENNFDSREACETDCPKEIEKDLCHLPAETGSCGNYVERWYYDTRERSCRQFYYGGCEGNENNFQVREECEQRCSQNQPLPPTSPTGVEGPFSPEMCLQPSDPGTCDQPQIRYFYDQREGVCKPFTFTGCGGNRNNFANAEECQQYCGNAQDVCSLPPVVGSCDGVIERYYYEGRTGSCAPFTYGGCGGNYNNFEDKASCEQRCRTGPPEPPQTVAPPVEPPLDSVCYEPPDQGNCTDNIAQYYYDAVARRCTPFAYTGCGGNANRYNSEEQCERQCGQFRGQDVCNLPQDAGQCSQYSPKYYFDRASGRCAYFYYSGCGGNGNRFSSNEECEYLCLAHDETRPNVTSNAICRFPADTGACTDTNRDHTRWYFDEVRGQCVPFIYSGCGGNFNNFNTFESCIDTCRELLVGTTPSTGENEHPCQAHFDECATLRCPYGIEAYVDENSCNRCQCHNPCAKVICDPGTQCAIDLNRNRTTNEDPNFIAVCREISKPGECPNLQPTETNCGEECRTDADCSLQLKCCRAGCRSACVEPAEVPAEHRKTTEQPQFGYTPSYGEYSPPKVDPLVYEPEVRAVLGDYATLNCAVTGNPNPKVTWRKGDLLIDGTQAKYRIRLDQSLQIITLHKTDSGIYLCTADNQVGAPVTNQIKLEVLDGDERPASVLDEEPQRDVVVSLNAPATLNCLALGYPFPAVTWWKDDSLIPLKTSQFEVRKDYSLLINSVKLSNLGIYTCQAYNGVGKAASWSVVVKARGPYHSTNPEDEKYMHFIVNPPEIPVTDGPQHIPVWPDAAGYRPSPPPDSNQLPPLTPNETNYYPPVFVPVRTDISLENPRFPVGGDVVIPCNVDGYPAPQVNWYKDGIPLQFSDRIQISETQSNILISTLTVRQATIADSGAYQCEAANTYSKASSSQQIVVEGTYIDPNCKDNRFFANCSLIVKGNFCNHKYYARFCCRSCTEAGLLPGGGGANPYDRQTAISNNLV